MRYQVLVDGVVEEVVGSIEEAQDIVDRLESEDGIQPELIDIQEVERKEIVDGRNQ